MTQFPIIHSNGTSRQSLITQYHTAWHAVGKALGAILAIEVHGRDYYPISSEAASVAMKEHEARIQALEAIYKDLYNIIVHIQEA